MQQGRPLGGQQLVQRSLDLVAMGDAESRQAEGAGDLDEIGIIRQVDFTVIFLVEQFLPLAHQAERGIVEQNDLQGDVVAI